MASTRICILPTGFALALSVLVVGVVRSAPAAKEPPAKNNPFVEWEQLEDFVKDSPHDPLVVGENVIVGTDLGELRAYRCRDGKQVWSTLVGGRIYHHPCSDGQRLFCSSPKGVSAVSAKDGQLAWSFELKSCDGPTLVLPKKGLVYVGGDDGQLYALNSKTGNQEWAADFIKDAPKDPEGFDGQRARIGATLARPSALASDGEVIYLSVFDQCRVVAFNAGTGKRIWSHQTQGWVGGMPLVTDKHLFIGSQDDHFYCLDKATGKEQWKFKTGSRVESGGAADRDSVYFASCDGNVYSLKQSDGKLNWKFATERREDGRGAIYSVPILRWGRVHLATGEGQVYAVDQASGNLKWKLRPSKGSDIYCTAATDGERFFVVTRPRNSARSGHYSLVAIGLK